MQLLNHDGAPYWLELEPGENLSKALAAVPDDILIGCYERTWADSGLPIPHRTAGGLRRRILADWKRQPAQPSTRLLPVSAAALELGVPETTLRLRIQQGKFKTAHLPSGALGVEMPSKRLRRHVLIPHSERPDPRLTRSASRRSTRP